MGEASRDQVYSVLLATLRPLVSMLMRAGLSYKDFERVSRMAFVQVAGDSSEGKRSRSASRIALRTGLPRKAVTAVQRDSLMAEVREPEIRSVPSEILHIWHTDKRFCVRPGVPRELDWDGSQDSFVALARSASQSHSAATMRDELMRVGAIEESSPGRLLATRRSFVPVTSIGRLIQGLQYGVRPLAMTVAHNAAAGDTKTIRFQRIVWNYCLPKEKRGEVDRIITQRLEEISQEIDDMLTEVEVDRGSADSSVFGVGLYHFEDDPNDVTDPSV